MSTPSPTGGPPSSGPASRSSSVASIPPVLQPEGDANGQETSPSPPHYPPILRGSSDSSTPPSLRKTVASGIPSTASVTISSPAQRVRHSAGTGNKGNGAAIQGPRRASGDIVVGINAGISTTVSSTVTASTATTSNTRTSRRHTSNGPPLQLPPKPTSVALLGAISSITVSGVSTHPAIVSGTVSSAATTRRSLSDEVGIK